MQFNLEFNFNGVELFFLLLGWGLVLFFFYRIYKNQDEKLRPKLWKGIVTILIGLFSFTINLTFLQNPISLAILPLGVWILYALRKGRWEVYRKYAWLGFAANYVFLATTIVGILFHGILFPKDQAATFISGVENASLHIIHPSAPEAALDNTALEQAMDSMQKNEIDSHRWYNSIVLKEEKVERFPYLLAGTDPSFGSGLSTQIFVEQDGQGLLITTIDQRQYYFRSDQPFLKVEGGEKDE